MATTKATARRRFEAKVEREVKRRIAAGEAARALEEELLLEKERRAMAAKAAEEARIAALPLSDVDKVKRAAIPKEGRAYCVSDAVVADTMRELIASRAATYMRSLSDDRVIQGSGPLITLMLGSREAGYLTALGIDCAARERAAMLAIFRSVLAALGVSEEVAAAVERVVQNERGPVRLPYEDGPSPTAAKPQKAI